MRGWVKNTQGLDHLWEHCDEGTWITLCGGTVAEEEVILSSPAPKGACKRCSVLAPLSSTVAP